MRRLVVLCRVRKISAKDSSLVKDLEMATAMVRGLEEQSRIDTG